MALAQLVEQLGDRLVDGLPALWAELAGALLATDATRLPADVALRAVEQLAAAATAAVPAVQGKLLALLPELHRLLQTPPARVRFAAARAVAALASMAVAPTMAFVLDHTLPLLGDAGSATHRRGAIEALYGAPSTPALFPRARWAQLTKAPATACWADDARPQSSCTRWTRAWCRTPCFWWCP